MKLEILTIGELREMTGRLPDDGKVFIRDQRSHTLLVIWKDLCGKDVILEVVDTVERVPGQIAE